MAVAGREILLSHTASFPCARTVVLGFFIETCHPIHVSDAWLGGMVADRADKVP